MHAHRPGNQKYGFEGKADGRNPPSEEQSYLLLIDCYRSGEISSQKEDIMIKNFISRKKQVIITSTLKKEEYTVQKYDQYKGDANVIDYSNNESSKLLQSQYVARLGSIVGSFEVMFTEE